ncbi:unnamed protein product [Rotaria sp. Silwood2]|nr:unnamed protein product [Rotaria sp. Silwood2]CAF4379813.1 unnamed protein product [Rotaria sp. Silwood2]
MPNRNENVAPSVVNDVTVVQSKSKLSHRLSIIREFSLNTSTHALPGIARSESLHNRIFWSLSFIIFAGIMVYFVVTAILNYFSYPTSMDASFISEWPQEFPAVSFCNISPLRLDLFWNPFLNYSIMSNWTTTNDTKWGPSQFLDLARFFVNTLNRNETLDMYFYSLSSMMYKCTFNNMPCSINDFISFISPVYGACYTFNAKLKNNASRNILYANEYGGDGKLSIGLYMHSHQYVPFLMEGFGAVALVHDNTQLPLIEAAGIELAAGQRHKIGYRKKTTYFLSSPYTTCTDNASPTMQAMFDYCSECLQECEIRSFIAQTSSLSLPGAWEMKNIKKFVENSTIPLPANWSSTWQDEIRTNYLTINIIRETSIVENNTQSASMAIQIPNPSRYRINVTRNDYFGQHYAIDRKLGKMSRVGLSNEGSQSVVGSQDLYLRNESLTYSFELKLYPARCIANRGGPYDYMDYWAGIVISYGGENKTSNETIFDEDCGGDCLAWPLEYNSTAIGYTVRNRLYIRKVDLAPIKLVNKLYDLYTGKWMSTDIIKYTDWTLHKIPDSEFDYLMDVKKCYYA